MCVRTLRVQFWKNAPHDSVSRLCVLLTALHVTTLLCVCVRERAFHANGLVVRAGWLTGQLSMGLAMVLEVCVFVCGYLPPPTRRRPRQWVLLCELPG